jgi:hypothetical protein
MHLEADARPCLRLFCQIIGQKMSSAAARVFPSQLQMKIFRGV